MWSHTRVPVRHPRTNTNHRENGLRKAFRMSRCTTNTGSSFLTTVVRRTISRCITPKRYVRESKLTAHRALLPSLPLRTSRTSSLPSPSPSLPPPADKSYSPGSTRMLTRPPFAPRCTCPQNYEVYAVQGGTGEAEVAVQLQARSRWRRSVKLVSLAVAPLNQARMRTKERGGVGEEGGHAG